MLCDGRSLATTFNVNGITDAAYTILSCFEFPAGTSVHMTCKGGRDVPDILAEHAINLPSTVFETMTAEVDQPT